MKNKKCILQIVEQLLNTYRAQKYVKKPVEN